MFDTQGFSKNAQTASKGYIPNFAGGGIIQSLKEKAKKIGYEILDLYYYNSSVIEAFLPSIIAESYEIPVAIKDLLHGPASDVQPPQRCGCGARGGS